MAGAGGRDRLVDLEVNIGTTENDLGEPVEVWGEYCRAWARVFYGRGEERREAAREGALQAAVFNVLTSSRLSQVSPGEHRIRYDNALWDITATAPIGRGEIDISATRRRA